MTAAAMPSAGRVRSNGVDIAYQTSGDPRGRPLLMVMGLGTPMVAWHPDLCALLVEHGYFLIRFDNRDVGGSTHLQDAPVPDLGAVAAGDVSSVAYTVEDMAEDAVGLLDELGVPAAHVVGISLGGMIAQTMAARRPDRVLTLTSVMSSPSPELTNSRPEAQAALMRPPAKTRDAAIRQRLEMAEVIGSPGFPTDTGWVSYLAGELFDRGVDARGVLRQFAAIQASGDRTAAVRGITVPTLVVHGDSDPLVDLAAGRFTAEIIDGARLLVIPGMGHDMPRGAWPPIVQALDELTGDAGGASAGHRP